VSSRRATRERDERDTWTIEALLEQAKAGLRRGAEFAARWTNGQELAEDLRAVMARIDSAIAEANDDEA